MTPLPGPGRALYRRHCDVKKLEDVGVPDAIFAHARLAAMYDFLDDDRSDLDVYTALVDELGAMSVLDIGCGTGTFACELARAGSRLSGSIRQEPRSRSPAGSPAPSMSGGCTATRPASRSSPWISSR